MGKVIQNENIIANFNGLVQIIANGGLVANEINPQSAEYTSSTPEETET